MSIPWRRTPGAKRRKRFKFSLNGLAIQLSAFALSFTLVALLVVSGSQHAFVEENETVTDYTPAATAPVPDPRPRGGVAPVSGKPASVSPTPSASPTAPPTPEPIAAVALTDDDAGTAMFGDVTLAPGVTVERCIRVIYLGEADPDPVVLYAAEVTGDLSSYLDLTIDMADDAAEAFGSCGEFPGSDPLFEGTLADFAAAHAGPLTGRAAWHPDADGDSRVFRFRLTVRDDPAAAGRTTGFGFSWRTSA
jgi:hypothetical protein